MIQPLVVSRRATILIEGELIGTLSCRHDTAEIADLRRKEIDDQRALSATKRGIESEELSRIWAFKLEHQLSISTMQ